MIKNYICVFLGLFVINFSPDHKMKFYRNCDTLSPTSHKYAIFGYSWLSIHGFDRKSHHL